MYKIPALLISLTMTSLLLPGGVAAESVTSEYTSALGGSARGLHPAAFLGLQLCPETCDFNQVCANVPEVGQQCTPHLGVLPVVQPFGGVRLEASGIYTNVIVSSRDDVFGSEAAFSVCFWNPDGDNTCADGGDNPDFRAPVDCGTKAAIGSPFASNFVTSFVYNIHVAEDLNVCGGSQGSINGDFF